MAWAAGSAEQLPASATWIGPALTLAGALMFWHGVTRPVPIPAFIVAAMTTRVGAGFFLASVATGGGALPDPLAIALAGIGLALVAWTFPLLPFFFSGKSHG